MFVKILDTEYLNKKNRNFPFSQTRNHWVCSMECAHRPKRSSKLFEYLRYINVEVSLLYLTSTVPFIPNGMKRKISKGYPILIPSARTGVKQSVTKISGAQFYGSYIRMQTEYCIVMKSYNIWADPSPISLQFFRLSKHCRTRDWYAFVKMFFFCSSEWDGLWKFCCP